MDGLLDDDQESGEETVLNQNEKFICSICGNSLKTKNSLKEHLEIHTDKKLACLKCLKAFKSSRLLKAHENSVHVAKPVNCLVCSQLCMNKQALQRHMNTHLGKFKICEVCQRKFSNKTQLDQHRKREHEEIGSFECVYCQHLAQTKFALEEHIIRCHSSGRIFQCIKCAKICETEQEYKEHQQNHRNELSENNLIKKNYKDKPIICEICQKWNRGKWWYEVHKRTHTNERPFKCKECSKSFACNGALTKHMKLHSSTYDYQCDDCGKYFREKKNLMIHAYKHSGITPFTCDICEASLTTNSLLNKHLIQHKQKNETIENFSTLQREKIKVKEAIKRSRNLLKFGKGAARNKVKILIEEVVIEPLPVPKKRKCRILNPKITPAIPRETSQEVLEEIEEQYEIMEVDYGEGFIYNDQGECLNENEDFICEDVDLTKEASVIIINGYNSEYAVVQNEIQMGMIEEKSDEEPTKSMEVLRKEQRLLNGRKVAEAKLIFNTLSNRCQYCKKRFDSKEQLSFHIVETHVADRPFECQICEFRFKVKAKFKRHMKIHSDKKDLECPVCGYKCARSDNMNCHIEGHAKVKKFACKFCQKTFRCLTDANSHMFKCKEKQNKQEKATSKIIRYTSLEKINSATNDIGAITESPILRYRCAICLMNEEEVNFSNQSEAYAHLKMHNYDPLIHNKKIVRIGKTDKLDCNICEGVYESGNIYKHVKENHSEFKHQCPECHVLHNSFVHLKKHVKIEHLLEESKKTTLSKQKSSLACDICGLELSGMRQLKQHRNKHFNDCLINCEHCDKEFFSSNSYHSHLVKSHEALKNH